MVSMDCSVVVLRRSSGKQRAVRRPRLTRCTVRRASRSAPAIGTGEVCLLHPAWTQYKRVVARALARPRSTESDHIYPPLHAPTHCRSRRQKPHRRVGAEAGTVRAGSRLVPVPTSLSRTIGRWSKVRVKDLHRYALLCKGRSSGCGRAQLSYWVEHAASCVRISRGPSPLDVMLRSRLRRARSDCDRGRGRDYGSLAHVRGRGFASPTRRIFVEGDRHSSPAFAGPNSAATLGTARRNSESG